MSRRLSLIVFIICLLSLACSLSDYTISYGGEPTAETYYPRIAVTPFGAPPGGTHQVEFLDFPPNREFEVSLVFSEGAQQIESFNIQVDNSGYSRISYATSPDTAWGSYFFDVSGSDFGQVQGQMVIAPDDTSQFPDSQQQEPEQDQPQDQQTDVPRVDAFPYSGPPSTTHDLVFTGFPANSAVTVNFYDPNGILLVTFDAKINSTGSGSGWIQTASDSAPGAYLLEVIGTDLSYATNTVQVTDGGQSQSQEMGQNTDHSDTEFNGVMNALILNLNIYWSQNFSQVWPEYQNAYFQPDVFAYQPPITLPGCNIPAEKTYNNAFYCGAVNTVYYDEVWLKQKYEEYGVTFPAYIIAHEWGHAAQDILGVFNEKTLSINVEFQADCFTGAYFSWGEEKGYYSLDEISNVAYIIIPAELAEKHWTWTGDQAHGGALRTGVFGQGYTNGLDYCKDYEAYVP